MSSARRDPTIRRAKRSNLSSPYARPVKKSSWTFTGLISSLFNPLKSRSGSSSTENLDQYEEPEEIHDLTSSDAEVEDDDRGDAPPPTLNSRSNNVLHTQAVPQTPPPPRAAPTQAFLQTPPPSSSPSKNLEAVATFLHEKGNQPLNRVEVAGLVSLLQESVDDDDVDGPAPFRFATSPTSTPLRGNSPNTVPFPMNGTSSSQKMLSKNPNGVYRWQGGGSALRSRTPARNRYQSPGFGSPSTPRKYKLSTPSDTPKTSDSKRRRVGEESNEYISQHSASSSAQTLNHSQSVPSSFSSKPFPTSSIKPTLNGISSSAPKPNGFTFPSTPIRLPPKPTTPANPSPLRQAWAHPTPSPPQQPADKRKTPTPTKAATVMTELLKEVTAVKKSVKLDVTNPYQAASPVKPPPRKAPLRRARTQAKQANDKAVDEDVEMSARAVIEATMPKGLKRHRPPTKTTDDSGTSSPSPLPSKSRESAPSLRRSARLQSPEPEPERIASTSKSPSPFTAVVEEVDDDEEDSEDVHIAKKQKKVASVNGIGRPAPRVTVEEVDDDEDEISSASKPSTFSKPSEIIEPGDTDTPISSPKAPFAGFASTPSASTNGTPPPFVFGSAAKSTFAFKSTAPKEPSKLRFSYQAEKEEPTPEPAARPAVTTTSPASLSEPSSTPVDSSSANAPIVKVDPKDAACLVAEYALPSFTFVLNDSSNRDHVTASASHTKARTAVKALPISSLPTFDLSSSSAAASTSGQSSSSTSPGSTGGFNWAAAGMKPPPLNAAEGAWTCAMCSCSNLPTATDKCTVCEEPRPEKSKSNTSGAGFDWAAAGLKPPSSSGSSWICSKCMLSNPSSADKCNICDNPR